MKMTNLLLSAATFSLISLSIMSCSKDAISKPPQQDRTTGKTSASGLDGKGIWQVANGSLLFYVLPPEAKPVVTIFNDNFSTEELTPNNENIIYLNSIPVGEYAIRITPNNKDFSPMEIKGVMIEENTRTYLGEIIIK